MSKFDEMDSWDKEKAVEALTSWFWVKRGLITLFTVVGFGMAGCPPYNVWEQGLTGEAELKRAEQNRKIRVQEAQAKLESAKHLAKAEIERAKGAAEANRIVAKSLGGPEGYLRWLYIEMLNETENNLIYIPTEAGLPVLEAGRSVK